MTATGGFVQGADVGRAIGASLAQAEPEYEYDERLP